MFSFLRFFKGRVKTKTTANIHVLTFHHPTLYSGLKRANVSLCMKSAYLFGYHTTQTTNKGFIYAVEAIWISCYIAYSNDDISPELLVMHDDILQEPNCVPFCSPVNNFLLHKYILLLCFYLNKFPL